MPLVTGLDHVTILTNRLDETIDFYTELLGLENRPEGRPAFGFPGAWLWLDDRPVVHLIFRDDDPGPPSGSFDHVAFAAADFDDVHAYLEERGIEYEETSRLDLGLLQLFVLDPNGVRVEISTRV